MSRLASMRVSVCHCFVRPKRRCIPLRLNCVQAAPLNLTMHMATSFLREVTGQVQTSGPNEGFSIELPHAPCSLCPALALCSGACMARGGAAPGSLQQNLRRNVSSAHKHINPAKHKATRTNMCTCIQDKTDIGAAVPGHSAAPPPDSEPPGRPAAPRSRSRCPPAAR